jgi:hypothetical protein
MCTCLTFHLLDGWASGLRLARTRKADDRLVRADRYPIGLCGRVEVDVDQKLGQANATTGLMATLLPDWKEYWLMVEREWVRQALATQLRSPACTDGGSR